MNNHRLYIRTGGSKALVNNEEDVAEFQPIYNETRRYLSIRGKGEPKEYRNIKPIVTRELFGFYAEDSELQGEVSDDDLFFVGGVIDTNGSKLLLIENKDSIAIKLKNKNGSFVLSTEGNATLDAGKHLSVDIIKPVTQGSGAVILLDYDTKVSGTLEVVKGLKADSTLDVLGNVVFGADKTVSTFTAYGKSEFKDTLTVGGKATLKDELEVGKLGTFKSGIKVDNGIVADKAELSDSLKVKNGETVNVTIDKDGNATFANATKTKTLNVAESSTFGGDLNAEGQTLTIKKIVVGA